MKKNKSGFSLAEILIALAIVSIIATACFSVAKRGIERAYDQYIYTGVAGITDAIRYANAQSFVDSDGNTRAVNINDAPNDFYKHIKEALSGKETSNIKTILAPNNIQYIFSNYRNAGDVTSYKIAMNVPSNRTSGGAKAAYVLIYVVSPKLDILIPAMGLDQRIDLLPYYIDNGNVGRYKPNASGVMVYTPVQYYSFKEAFCKSNDPIVEGNIYTCGEISKTTFGTPTLVNPRKLRPF